jgi:hypothetical protein
MMAWMAVTIVIACLIAGFVAFLYLAVDSGPTRFLPILGALLVMVGAAIGMNVVANHCEHVENATNKCVSNDDEDYGSD